MKWALLLLLPVFLTTASCKKEYIVPANKTIVVNLQAGSWIPLNGGKSYTAAINVPELDDYLNERGGVLVYISFGGRTYEQIPQLYNGESYSFVTRPGQVVLEVQEYDGLVPVTPPGSMTVKIILIESDF
ncbi:MAG: hypothetical protein H7Y13_14420 [Sphingobacteriaceae bacterium]|nr:hypothetical protein [Sphingobacteriaceae bacterium]